MKEKINRILRESIEVKEKVMENLIIIEEMARMIIEAYKQRKKVVIFGNGGSAADAQHLATEFVSRFKLERATLPAIALTTNTSILTAISNDYDFSTVFSRQVEAVVHKGDVAIGISTSGNSPNVVKGIEQAKKQGAKTIVFTGKDGGLLRDMADLAFVVPSTSTPRIQESHITVGHVLCEIVEEEMFKK